MASRRLGSFPAEREIAVLIELPSAPLDDPRGTCFDTPLRINHVGSTSIVHEILRVRVAGFALFTDRSPRQNLWFPFDIHGAPHPERAVGIAKSKPLQNHEHP